MGRGMQRSCSDTCPSTEAFVFCQCAKASMNGQGHAKQLRYLPHPSFCPFTDAFVFLCSFNIKASVNGEEQA